MADSVGAMQVWIRDVREAVELLDEATGQRTPKEQVRCTAVLPCSLRRLELSVMHVNAASSVEDRAW